MPDITNPLYLQKQQYKDASRLNARVQLHKFFSINPYGWFKWVFEQFDLPGEPKILEVGCGPATLWVENLYRLPSGWSITLSDFSPGMLQEARKAIEQNDYQFTYTISNAMAIPFPSDTFDTVIADHMLYHITDLQIALSEINRVLKPYGKLFATTNGNNHLRELDELMDRYLNFGGKNYSTSFSSGKFTLENGLQQLSPWFSPIGIKIYDDGLMIDEASPLVAYMLSMVPQEDIPPDKDFVTELTTAISRIITKQGSINIQKSNGMFICQKKGKPIE